MESYKSKPIMVILIFYFICFFARGIEYFIFRTDQTFIGEAIIHKLAGILFLAVALKLLSYKWSAIGFTKDGFFRNALLGLVLGLGTFIVAYATEMIMQTAAGNVPKLGFFVTSYAISGNRNLESGILFIALCIIGNVVNVIMEEGVFRGFFNKMATEKYSFIKACLLSSALFGFWHIAQPVRNVLDGSQSVMGAIMASLLLIVTSALLGIQLSMLWKMTGSLWAGMAAHFINNASINLIHVITTGGTDELQTIRITIAQTLSFVIVLILFMVSKRNAALNKG